METDSSRALPLKYEQISKHSDEISDYINNRRRGRIKPLKTRWNKFNKIFNGGFEPGTLITVAGISGSGKSSFLSSLENDLFEYNPDIDFVVLSFTFEMAGSRNVGRKLSYKLRKTTSELYSGDGSKLNDNEYNKVQNEIEKIKQLPIYYVDSPGTVDQIKQTILSFSEREGKNKWIVVVLDHTLLTRGARGEEERITLANLQRMFIEVKKWNKTTVIQLSQLNRNIESVDRIANNSMHYPMRVDLFGGESLMQASDIVVVLHRPEVLGIINNYGPRRMRTEGRIYLHVLKNREGEAGVVMGFENNLKYNRLDELSYEESESQTKSNDIKLNF